MSDTTTDPQISDPPTNSGGGTGPTADETTTESQVASEPPTNTGGDSGA